MDFSQTQISGLLNNISHEKAKYTLILSKLKMLLGLIKGHELIVNKVDKLVLTEDPLEIYESINFNHPLLKILCEHILKVKECVGGPKYFIEVCKYLSECISFLVENGKNNKILSDKLKDIANDIDLIKKSSNFSDEFIFNEEIEMIIKSQIKDEYISSLLVDAIKTVKSYSSESIRICKVATGSLEDSYKVNGFILNKRPEGSVVEHTNTSVGLFNCPLDIERTELKGTVLFHNSKELLNFSNDEMKRIKEKVDSINVNVVVVCGSVNDLFVEFLNERKIMVLRVFNKYDLKRISDVVDGCIYNSFGPVKKKGFVKKIECMEDGGNLFTKIVGGNDLVTLVLKNSVKEIIDEKESVILRTFGCLEHKTNYEVAESNLIDKITEKIGTGNAITANICKSLSNVPDTLMFRNDKLRCIKHAFEMIALLLEIDDYLVAKQDALDVKPPQHAGHWDEDH